MRRILEGLKIIAGLDPSADLFDTNPSTDVISMRNFQRLVFVLRQKTAGTNTGTATVTILAASDATGANSEAIAFDYYKNEAVASSDAFGAKVAATASGFSTTANKNAIYAAEIRTQDLPRGKPFVFATLTETVNDPVKGDAYFIVGDGPEGAPNDLPSAIA